jgi:hypothetical protein
VARKRVEIVACYDRQRRTCIQVERTDKVVKFIPLDVGSGLRVRKLPASEFDNRYQPIVNYPAERACQLYLSYSQNIGASKEALEYLGRVINVSKQEVEMATKKQQAASQSEEKRAAKGRRETNVAEKPAKTGRTGRAAAKPATSKPAKSTAAKTPAVKSGEKRPSAAQMFQDLIMAGKLTDDQIFEKVQAEFGLDEKKRGYVKWYRNHLRKQGKNPPEPKAAK